MRSVVRTIPTVLILALAGCGSHGDDREAVGRLFDRLAVAQRSGDANEACTKVFLVQEEGGEAEGEEEERREADNEGESESESGESPAACRAAFTAAQRSRKAQVRTLRSSVQSVKVDGDKATATVRSTVRRTDGSAFTNVYERDLVRKDGKWRIRISPEG